MPTQTVTAFVVPNFTKEQLVDGPQVAVRTGGRELEVDQGPDTTKVVIEVGVVGALPQGSSSNYRAEEVAACDVFDGLMEEVIAFWMNGGPLSGCALAEHRFDTIEQAINFDPQKLYNDGIWLSLVQLTYQDTVD